MDPKGAARLFLAAGKADEYPDAAHLTLLTLDHRGRVSHVNRTGCEMLGREEADILGMDWFDTFVPPGAGSAMRGLFRRTMAGADVDPGRFESPVVSPSRGERLIAWQAAPIRLADGRVSGMILCGLDVTEQERSRADRERLLKELGDVKFALNHSAIVATTDVTGVITAVNDKFCEISKYSREELLGQDHRIVNSGYHGKEFFRDLWTTIAGGRLWKGEIRNRAKDGALYWVDTTIVPFVDASGKPYQYMAIRHEVTKQREAEARLRRQETLARLGEMSAVVAHEVKNPLAGISGALQVISSRLPADSRDRAILGDIQDRIVSLNRMVQDLLVFSHPKDPALAPNRMRAVIEEAGRALRRDRSLADVAIAITGSDPAVPLDREQMHRVFLNLLLNAAQAMGRRGAIDVGITTIDWRCEVTVADRGRGIAPDDLGKAFQPFFTTKHRGTGLGLPIARRIVEAHGGTLTASARHGGGVVVAITLPVPASGSPSASRTPASGAAPASLVPGHDGLQSEPHAPANEHGVRTRDQDE